jgi:hypothetical protein
MEPIEYKFGAMGDIYSVSRDAILFLKSKQGRGMEQVSGFFIFNEVKVNCFSTSEPRDIVEKYMYQHYLRSGLIDLNSL